MQTTRGAVLVVDDSAEFRSYVVDLLEHAGFATLEAATGEDALAIAANDGLSLVVLDVNLPGTSGYVVCTELRQRLGRRLPIMFVSGERTESFDRVAGLLLGADDYLAKPFDGDEFVARVSRMIERAALLRGSPSQEEDQGHGLTPREREVLGLLVDGLDQRQIAERLFVSPKTVATHIQRILRKLGVGSRTQAVAVAARERLFERTA